MSSVTLESLRVDYLASFQARSVAHRSYLEGNGKLRDRALSEQNYAKASETYLIAIDFGPEAAMLYKLSDGNIDPRTKPE